MRLVGLFSLLGLSILFALEARQEGLNNGQDVTRPITRVDARIKAQAGDNGRKSRAWITTARMDKSLHFENGWQVGLRFDLPYEWYRCPDVPNCQTNVDHIGDSLAQGFIVPPSIGNWTYAIGLQIIFPTAADYLQIGQGKLQLLPSFAFKYALTDWGEDCYWGLILRESTSICGYKSAPYVTQTYIQPFINITLPCNWFVNSSPEMRYNARTKRWFVPFDLMIGNMITPALVVSLEYESAIVYDYKNFTQELEFRIGFFY